MSQVFENLDFNLAPITKITVNQQLPRIRAEVIYYVREYWNNNKEIQWLKGMVKIIEFDAILMNNPDIYIGEWNTDGRFVIRDNSNMEPRFYKSITCHELNGHAFFDWACDNRINELKEFCEEAHNTQPINNYVKSHEDLWKKRTDAKGYTHYQDEQHSAMAQIVNDMPVDYDLCEDIDLIELKQLYGILHSIK